MLSSGGGVNHFKRACPVALKGGYVWTAHDGLPVDVVNGLAGRERYSHHDGKLLPWDKGGTGSYYPDWAGKTFKQMMEKPVHLCKATYCKATSGADELAKQVLPNVQFEGKYWVLYVTTVCKPKAKFTACETFPVEYIHRKSSENSLHPSKSCISERACPGVHKLKIDDAWEITDGHHNTAIPPGNLWLRADRKRSALLDNFKKRILGQQSTEAGWDLINRQPSDLAKMYVGLRVQINELCARNCILI